MDLLITLLWLMIIFMVARSFIVHMSQAAEVDRMQQRMLNHADMMIRIVKLEPLPDQGTILAYDGENNQFLGQGKDEHELKDNIMQRFPEKVFLLNDKPFTANKKVEVKLEKSNTR